MAATEVAEAASVVAVATEVASAEEAASEEATEVASVEEVASEEATEVEEVASVAAVDSADLPPTNQSNSEHRTLPYEIKYIYLCLRLKGSYP